MTITFGPFAGLSGVVIATTPERTVVRVILKGRSIPVEMATDMIRQPIRDRMQRTMDARPSRPA